MQRCTNLLPQQCPIKGNSKRTQKKDCCTNDFQIKGTTIPFPKRVLKKGGELIISYQLEYYEKKSCKYFGVTAITNCLCFKYIGQ